MSSKSTDVLLLTLCTLRADHLGAYGHALASSPVIDGLAERGALFERALTPAPWTRPRRRLDAHRALPAITRHR